MVLKPLSGRPTEYACCLQWYIWPKAGFENFSTPIILQYSCYLSVGVNTSVNPAMAIGIFSQWWVRTRYPRWFTKYKYASSLCAHRLWTRS